MTFGADTLHVSFSVHLTNIVPVQNDRIAQKYSDVKNPVAKVLSQCSQEGTFIFQRNAKLPIVSSRQLPFEIFDVCIFTVSAKKWEVFNKQRAERNSQAVTTLHS